MPIDVISRPITQADVGEFAVFPVFEAGKAMLKKFGRKLFSITTRGRSPEENSGMWSLCEYVFSHDQIPKPYVAKWHIRSAANLYDHLKLMVGFCDIDHVDHPKHGKCVLMTPWRTNFADLPDEEKYQKLFKEPARRYLAEEILGLPLSDVIGPWLAWLDEKRIRLPARDKADANPTAH